MYTEILRIIEGGLSKDAQKVYNYSKMLADKMQRDGESKMSKMILDSLEKRYTAMLSLDELSSTPVDSESRMSIVDVYRPTNTEIKPILTEFAAKKVNDFIEMILLDLNMPKVDGFAVLEFMRNNNLFTKMPVSIISGDSSKETIDRAFTYDIVDMLGKPFNEANIKSVVEKTMIYSGKDNN